MNKKILAFFIAFPAMLILFIFKVIPAISSLIISMKDYSIFRGIFGSTWVGGKNYSLFFKSPVFKILLRNTLMLNILSILFTCLLASILIICISKMPNRWCKLVSIIILSVPAFIPILSYVGVFIKALSADTGSINNILMLLRMEPKSFLTDRSYYAVIFTVMDSLRNIYVPVIIGVLLCDNDKNTDLKKIVFIMIGYIFTRITILLSPDIENILISYNPLVYENADVFDTYAFRNGLMQDQIALSSTVWVIKTIAQIFLNIIIYFSLARILPNVSKAANKLSERVNHDHNSIIGIIGYVLLAIGSLAVIILVIPAPNSFFDGTKMLLMNKWFILSLFNSLMYGVLSCAIYGFITITLAYPLTTKSKLYPFILIFIMSLTNNIIGEYIVFRSLGTVNTIFPVIICSSLSVMGAFALHFTISSKFRDHVPDFSEYIKASILPLIAIVTLFFTANWGSYLYQLIFLNDRSLYGIGLLGREILFATGGDSANDQIAFESIRSAYIFISSIIPISLGTILICLNKYLPLTAFSVQTRKG